MHVAIDLLAESPATLRLAARLLLDHADVIEGKTPANVPAGTSGNIPTPPPVVPVPPAPAASNVLPFVPPPPNVVPAAGSPAPSTGSTPMVPPAPTAPTATPAASTLAPAVPVPPVPTTTPPNALPAMTTTGPIERDSAGVPWDARIHQKGKGVKKDKTWKLIKGIDPALVTAVVQELSAKGLIQTPAAVGASSAPVSLPPGVPPAPTQQGSQGYQAGQLPIPQAPGQGGGEAQAHIPPAPGGTQAQAVIPPAPAASVPVPPAAVLGMPDANNAGVVQIDFRGLVAKFTNARNAGKLTPQQITEIINQAGAPSLQLLGSMAHLVPVADALLDAALLQA